MNFYTATFVIWLITTIAAITSITQGEQNIGTNLFAFGTVGCLSTAALRGTIDCIRQRKNLPQPTTARHDKPIDSSSLDTNNQTAHTNINRSERKIDNTDPSNKV